ncbi:helix-turn-helix transcriptional regulator [bacterium]|nr:helix-turn-helix transcriptional regulator [bacterium]
MYHLIHQVIIWNIWFYKENRVKKHDDIPRLIKELRARTGLTQEKFAARLGVTYPTINRWENDRAKPSRPSEIQSISLLKPSRSVVKPTSGTISS